MQIRKGIACGVVALVLVKKSGAHGWTPSNEGTTVKPPPPVMNSGEPVLSKKMVRLRGTARKSVPGGPYRFEGFQLPEHVVQVMSELAPSKEKFGKIDVVVSNAATNPSTRSILEINVKSGILLVKIQLVRIQLRVTGYGWTTQKVFHFLNLLVNGVRVVVFVFRRDAQNFQLEACAVSTEGLRPTFLTINGVVYSIQVNILIFVLFYGYIWTRGNMKRGVDVISTSEKRCIDTLTSPEMTAIRCRFDDCYRPDMV
ncbi:hypothetical protein AgCh_002628 [Apium graveolens]